MRPVGGSPEPVCQLFSERQGELDAEGAGVCVVSVVSTQSSS